MSSRKDIPAELVRQLMIEAGYRCAIPRCRTAEPLEIEHIDDYAKVKTHEFSNMLVLCRNCHGRKGKGPRKIDRKALRIIKQYLGIVNQRYNDVERRILEHFVDDADASSVTLPETPVLFGYLLKDGLIEGLPGAAVPDALWGTTASSEDEFFFTRGYALTERGHEFVAQLRDNIAN